MSEHTPGCECYVDIARLRIGHGQSPSYTATFHRCPLHAAAPAMLELIEAVAQHFADTDAPLGTRAAAILREVKP